MDVIDARLLRMLQLDSAQSIAQLADAAAISPSACHRRMRALEEKGIIAGYGARLDPAKLGLAMIVFVEIALTSQSRESMEAFEKAVLGFDDILDCHLMSGSADYLLRIAASDPGQYDSIHRNCLSRLPGVASMRSSFSIRNIKPWRGFPITKGN